jgi:hypothetical protein
MDERATWYAAHCLSTPTPVISCENSLALLKRRLERIPSRHRTPRNANPVRTERISTNDRNETTGHGCTLPSRSEIPEVNACHRLFFDILKISESEMQSADSEESSPMRVKEAPVMETLVNASVEGTTIITVKAMPPDVPRRKSPAITVEPPALVPRRKQRSVINYLPHVEMTTAVIRESDGHSSSTWKAATDAAAEAVEETSKVEVTEQKESEKACSSRRPSSVVIQPQEKESPTHHDSNHLMMRVTRSENENILIKYSGSVVVPQQCMTTDNVIAVDDVKVDEEETAQQREEKIKPHGDNYMQHREQQARDNYHPGHHHLDPINHIDKAINSVATAVAVAAAIESKECFTKPISKLRRPRSFSTSLAPSKLQFSSSSSSSASSSISISKRFATMPNETVTNATLKRGSDEGRISSTHEKDTYEQDTMRLVEKSATAAVDSRVSSSSSLSLHVSEKFQLPLGQRQCSSICKRPSLSAVVSKVTGINESNAAPPRSHHGRNEGESIIAGGYQDDDKVETREEDYMIQCNEASETAVSQSQLDDVVNVGLGTSQKVQSEIPLVVLSTEALSTAAAVASRKHNKEVTTSLMKPSSKLVIQWRCNSCSRECIPVREESRCIWYY